MLPVTPLFRLDGKRALVTGAGRGLGFAAAVALAGAGAHVTLCSRSGDEIAAAARSIVDEGGSAETLVADVLDTELFSGALSACPAFDVLVNNAGTNRPMPFVDVTPEDFDAIVNLNVRSAFFVSQHVARTMMREGRSGSIINVSSQMGHVGAANRSVYCASKHALEGLTKAMAIELGPSGIRVNTVCPTFIETSMTKPFLADPVFAASVRSVIPLGRIGKVEDVMGALVFLASDASSLMTGSALMVDGGWTAG